LKYFLVGLLSVDYNVALVIILSFIIFNLTPKPLSKGEGAAANAFM
jgi:hypothetical protein